MSDTQVAKTDKFEHEKMKGSSYEYERYVTAKYYKNLTKSQFKNKEQLKSIDHGYARESLNPTMSLARLRDRIATTDAIAARYTVSQKEWVRLTLEYNYAKLMKYKFNYLIKFATIYKVGSELLYYRYLSKTMVMPYDVQISHLSAVTTWGLITAAAFAFI